MAIHGTAVDGQGEVTETSPGVFATSGMQANDIMHAAEDFLAAAGVVKGDDLKVTQRGAGANMSVDVAAGRAYVPNSGYSDASVSQTRFWRAKNSAVANVALNPANGSLPRIDLVILRKTSTIPNPDADNVFVLESSADNPACEGTPNAVPVAPATPNDSYLLATIAVGAGVTSITNSNITDQRKYAALLPPAMAEGQIVNGVLTRTVASNNLTVALKTLTGDDPSPSSPVYVRIGGTIRAITAALSITRNAGTNWADAGSTRTATKEIDWFVYLAWDSANQAVRIGFSRVPYGRIYSDLSSTSTNELYIAFDTAPSASDEMTVIGRFNAILSAAASFNWSVPGTSIIISRPIYETRRLDFVPALSASGSMTYTSTSINYAKYWINGRNVTTIMHHQGTVGGTLSNTITATLPFSNRESNIHTGGATGSFDSGNLEPAAAIVDASARNVNWRKAGAANLSAGIRQFALNLTLGL